ncbi:MAG TPA: 4-hydroxyphenylpyruvate dioxygenase [Solirubrobacteraceae bacterium]|jgi:4-hydroxyphenylpyruvate dioxygenase|nr:4-hydroxyphenylpyruvate dioxygenase [Solirubrobacteraceae bacterium]
MTASYARERTALLDAERGVEVERIDHVEFTVGNARQAARYLSAFGLRPIAYRGLETGSRETTSWLLASGDVRVVVTAGLTADCEVAERVRLHGDGVRDVAFGVPDVEAGYDAALARGAAPVCAPETIETPEGAFTRAAICACGDTIHSLVCRDGGPDGWLPGFVPIRSRLRPRFDVEAIDHVTLAVELGAIDRQVELYRGVLGFDQMDLAGLDTIATDFTALMSRVVEGGGGKIKFPIVEPAAGRKRSQIEEFLQYHGAPGVQHIGLTVSDIVAAAEAVQEDDVQLVDVQPRYYDDHRDLIEGLGLDVDAMRRCSVLVDEDEDGYLLQAFVKPLNDRPTFFFELIERHGSRGFGPRNVKHLFNALERDQRARGNL